MSNAFLESRKAIEQAREALRRGDRAAALKWGQEAARLAPESEDPWLILAAVASPQVSVNYIKRALELNPDSARARRGMQWAMQRLQAVPAPTSALPAQTPVPAQPKQPAGKKSSRFLLPGLLLALGCMVVIFAAGTALSRPALAAIRSLGETRETVPAPRPQSWAQAELPKPTYTATAFIPTEAPTWTPTSEPSATTTPEVTSTPEVANTPESTATPEASPTPGAMQAAIVPDTPTSEYAPAGQQPSSIAAAVYGERWIDVDLSQQRVYAYEGDTLMNSFIVSTGTWQTPTVTGTYKVWIKLRSTTMTGPGYYLPNVPYTMYFYKGYGLHGTYWHNNFGTPMSHGCVNLSIPDSEWLYNFASVGTTVNVHY
jgi:lipoprotein-anchoring transpeptidase ErfK/SrfK